MSNILLRSAIAALVLAALAYGAGVLFGHDWGWALLSVAYLALLLHHVRHLHLLSRWVSRSLAESVPEGTGAWRDVFTLLYRRQRAEIAERRKLARSLARSRQAGRALPYGVAIIDSEYRIVWCNDSCEAHFGIDFEADIGQPITYLVRQPEFVEYVSAEDFSKPMQLKTGRDGLVLSVQFVPYVESQRLLLSRDITQGIRLETMRRDFVANVSHELRTPLTVLVGFLETVRELKLDPERSRDYLNLMAEQGRRMQRIIDDLLTLSTLESAPEPPRDERVDVALLLSRIRSEAVALSAGRQRITLDAEPGFDLVGAESEIASALGNLASNAVRYTPSGGEVRIVWRGSPKGAEFTVEDNGVGIEAEHIPRLTERFYRVDRGRSRETGGTGLGLAIVKHALARHQATLDIESTPGIGSRFTAKFPARRVIPARTRTANDAVL
ncbi:MAG TPA: phosphate regulon sensor histidine kinase PhoR [Burkholderiales bacterium]|nr:phosphate regulon sensor histidine kinase PhoR [Burkholderiales bacterium]